MTDETHTFLFADLAGFTALTEVHGDEQAADLAGEFFAAVRELLASHGAEEVKTIGDAMLLRVNDPKEAIALGRQIIDEIGGRPGFPVVRIGMNTGPAAERDGDWFGATVNLAARVSAAAHGDQVLITEATEQACGKLDGIELHRHGVERFKNVAEPVALFSAVRTGDRSEGRPIDPVCRMAVEPGDEAGTLTHGGTEYHFCSLDCVRAFAAEPDRYTPG